MKQFKIVLLIIGTIIGAGFVSGKEISSFFSIFGYYSFIFILPIFFLLYYFINKLLLIGINKKINNVDDLNLIIFKKNNKIIKIFTFISFIILSSTMISAINTSFNIRPYSLLHFATILIIIIISCIAIYKDLHFIKNMCTIIVPFILFLMIIVCLINLNSPSNVLLSNIILLPYNVITYVCRNIFLSYFVVAKSSYGLNKHQCKQISFATALILCLIMTVVIFTELCNINIINSNMPLLDLSKTSSVLYAVYLIVLQFAIFTTLISTLLTLKTFFNFKSKLLDAIIPTIICACLSFISFNYFVVYLYPVIGILGFYLIYYLMSSNLSFQDSNQDIHKASQKTQNNSRSHN